MKVLVVEESPLTRKFIINELKTEGFAIQVAASAEEALSILETVPDISLITLRVVMEGMDGFQFVDLLHSREVRDHLRPLRNDQIPTIFVTSNDTDEDRLRGYQVGAADFIQKPWPKGDLVKHVNMALGRGSEFSGLTVLVVDDSRTARSFIASCLAHLGVTILQADDGETALEILADPSRPVDLVVTDLMMERMNGDELCVKIRGELGLTRLPVIFLSGNEDKTTILSLFKMGATDYLKKPFMKEELVARLRAYLEQESARKEMADSVSRLTETNLLKDEFLTVCSQDLYTPMGSILGYLDGLPEGDDDEGRLAGVRRSGRHLMSILSNLTDIGHIATGRQQVKLVKVDWKGILETAVAESRRVAVPKGIRLDLKVAAPRTVVRGDRAALLRIAGNLLSNALKFTRPGGRVAVTLADGRRGELVLEVADNGVGLDPATLPELFNRYCRRSTDGTSGEKGTGLGLALTRELVERHGGTMAVESAPGAGTTVRVILPLAQSGDLDPEPGEVTLGGVPVGSGLSVLLVDSDAGHLARGRLLLEGLGCRVSGAVSGMEAVDLHVRRLAADPFDLVILDQDLPVQSAAETAQALRDQEAAAGRQQGPILVMASRSLDGSLARLLAAGVSDFVAKPLVAGTVREALERLALQVV